MVRLAFLDLDGTLFPAGEEEIAPEILEGMQRLLDGGTALCIASGRSFCVLRHLFGSLSPRLYFIADDGALLGYGDRVLRQTPMPGAAQSRWLRALGSRRETDAPVLYSTPYGTVVRGGTESQRAALCRGYYGQVRLDAPVPERILKISFPGVTGDFAAAQAPAGVRLCYDRPDFAEFVSREADKGRAAKALQSRLGVGPAECAAFGDGINDRPLLQAVGMPYRRGDANSPLSDLTDNTFDTPRQVVQLLLAAAKNGCPAGGGRKERL